MTTTLELRGILPAMLTPFTEDGSAIDTTALAALTNRLVDAGVGGLIPGGSTGEFAALSHDERRLLHETVVEAAAGRVPVIAQTGALTAGEAVALSRHAEQVGAAGVMVVPPFYDGLSFRELKAYFTAVAESIDIPVMIYHIPGVTGQQLTPDEIGELASIPGVASIKDSGGDAGALTAVQERYGDRLQVCNGWDILTYFGLSYGLKASVWGAANIFPELAVELFETISVKGDLDAARSLWSRLVPVVNWLDEESYTARVKAATRLLGVQVGPVRSPFQEPTDEALAEVRPLLAELGLPVEGLASVG
ncbi:Dihydrodipicolinate synthetase family protein [Nostocoides japonicum T1-X7]|uniref:Dihydrodipicolinate synthetase family protein n=1 Tax=Nostocoides japonicum T1-X7 TaxID=1194083 RepID=A0A077LTM6_9MICO|nr:dihydrodipicolinate synthase family protein [Tetrasphaera japonica]CCH76963.1 Dihydrodipicolinate synthetase family protein [Tetrasphaera japonica T1-X7]